VEAERRQAAIWTMAVDSFTAEVVDRLEAARVDCLLLKGPAVADWLYADRAERPYADCDLLVAPGDVASAHGALARAGLRREFGPVRHVAMEAPGASPWRRSDGLVVDLHESLPGAHAPPARVWEELAAAASTLDLGPRTVRAPGPRALAVIVALHAAHHGPRAEAPLRDLARALERTGDAEWTEAAELARRIGAERAFANGLGLLPPGRALLARVGLEPSYSAAWLLEREPVPVAAGVERLATARGARAKAAILRDELLPSREFMRWWTPVARGGWPGLARAYLWRWLYLARSAPAAIRARRDAHVAIGHPNRYGEDLDGHAPGTKGDGS
jgi:hypothetical protein